jgi:hypothetical protein
VLPGVYSVIVPLPSVVVVVVVVSETCAHASGAATAKAILSSSCFIVLSFFITFRQRRTFPLPIFARLRKGGPGVLHCIIEDKLSFGREKKAELGQPETNDGVIL